MLHLRRYVAHNESLIRVMHHLWGDCMESLSPCLAFWHLRKTTNFNFKLEDDFLADQGTKFEFLLINGWKMKIPSTVNMTLFVDRRLLSYLFFADVHLLSSWYCSLNLNGNQKTLSTANSYFYISKREKRENIQFLSYESSIPSLPVGNNIQGDL